MKRALWLGLMLPLGTVAWNAHAASLAASVADATYSLVRTAGVTYDAGSSGTTNVTLQNGSTTDTLLQVGGTSANANIATAIIPFLLPTLNPGESFANVSFTIGSTASNGQQVDLYGLGRRASSAALASDYYRGTTGGDATDATLVQGAFVATTDTFGTDAMLTTSAAGSSALAAYLNTQYASGAGAGKYVFLRLNVTDTFSTDNTRINPAASESATASLRPTINYSVVPEPAAAMLTLLGSAGLMSRRRRVC